MDKIQPISFIIPSRNNLRYLKNAYQSIRDNLNLVHQICVASDYSLDGTVEWCEEIAKIDNNFKYIVNDGTWFGENMGELDRMGHTRLYDKIISDIAINDIIMIFHADMYAAKDMDVAMLKHLKPKVMVSATRIEPPLHLEEPNIKIINDFGIEPSEFVASDFDAYVETLKLKNKDKTTQSVFAPWLCYKSEFEEIGGHDQRNFAPQSKEDDDFWNRFMLNGGEFVQTWEGYVYHLTCRGSRFSEGAKRNPTGEVFMKNRETDEWLAQNMRSTRNFIRKWGFTVRHNEYGHPIVLPKYEISLIVENCTPELLMAIEPWCSYMYVDLPQHQINEYITAEQPNTLYDLRNKISVLNDKPAGDILVRFDASKLNETNINLISQFPDIIQDSGDVGTFDLEPYELEIRHLGTYEDWLIKADKSGELR